MHHAGIARLIHLNGPPAVGKSTIAAALVDDRPLALVVDIDELRVRLGGWREHPDSKRVARALGFGLVRQHLEAGHDVVLPQLLVRQDVIEELARIAEGAGAELVELILLAPADELRTRLDAISEAAAHPRDEFSTDELAAQIEHARLALEAIAAARPDARLVSVAGADRDAAVAAVRAAIA
jgi:predicted kinase